MHISSMLPNGERKNTMPDCNTKKAMMQATMEIVAEGGLNNFSMKKVTERVGVSEALVYKHFHTKENLLYSCFEAIHIEIGRLMGTLNILKVQFDQNELYQAVRLYWMIYFDHLVKNGSATLFYFAYRDSSYIKDIQAHNDEAKQGYFNEFVSFFNLIDAKRHIYEKIPSDHLWTYILDTTGIFAKRVIRGELADTPESREAILKLIFGGIMGVLED